MDALEGRRAPTPCEAWARSGQAGWSLDEEGMQLELDHLIAGSEGPGHNGHAGGTGRDDDGDTPDRGEQGRSALRAAGHAGRAHQEEQPRHNQDDYRNQDEGLLHDGTHGNALGAEL